LGGSKLRGKLGGQNYVLLLSRLYHIINLI
jgi:hypothetical protein